MTNHRVHLDDVLHKLVEQQHHTLKLDEFFQGSTKQSKYWMAREVWKQHLKVDDAELRAFCERLALTSVSESLDDFRQRMDEALHHYGLKASEPGTSSTIYDQLPYDWLAQGRNEFDAKSFREACGDEKLFVDQAPPPAKVFGVKSFEHGFDRLEARCDEVLSLLPEFSDRYLFANARASRIKLLVHDGFGVWCATRRLHAGRFVWHVPPTCQSGSAAPALQLSSQQFDALQLGLPWQRLGEFNTIRRC